MSSTRWRSKAVTAAAALALGVGLFAGLAPTPGLASSHREAPLVSADPQIDNTDTYAFVSPNKPDTVTLIASWDPFEEPAGGPNFYPWATGVHYDIKIDNDGDAQPDIIYRWIFTNHRRGGGSSFLYNNGPVTQLHPVDQNLLFYQTYDLQRIVPGYAPKTIVNDAIAVPDNVGKAGMPNYPALSDGGTVKFDSGQSATWAGQSDDPFFLDLRVFDLLYGGNLSEVGDDTLAGFNVNTMALQVPKHKLAKNDSATKNPIIGVWSTASRPSMRVTKSTGVTNSGDYVQVSRLGNPLVNEVVIPVKDKDKFNGSNPANDGQFLPYVNDPEVPHLLNAIYGLPIPDSNPSKPGIQRDDLISVFLTGVQGLNKPPSVKPSEEMRLNMSIPPCSGSCSRLGVIGGDNAGYPNGRRLADDVIDISLQVVAGELVGHPNSLGDGVNANDVSFLNKFPYVAYSHSGSDASPHD